MTSNDLCCKSKCLCPLADIIVVVYVVVAIDHAYRMSEDSPLTGMTEGILDTINRDRFKAGPGLPLSGLSGTQGTWKHPSAPEQLPAHLQELATVSRRLIYRRHNRFPRRIIL